MAAVAALLSGCGYHVGGRGDLLPKNIKTIAIPAFGNATTNYKLAQRLPADIARELITRTRYRVVADPREADAILGGAVMTFAAYTNISDPATGRGTGVQAIVNLQLSLTDRATGKVIFSRPGMEVKERYEISADPKAYFDEGAPAMQRLSQDVARRVVSAILEDF
jgi:hypothetical protein